MEKRITIRLDGNQKKIDLLNLHLSRRNFQTLYGNQIISVLYIERGRHYKTDSVEQAKNPNSAIYKSETIYFDSLGEFLVNINKYIKNG